MKERRLYREGFTLIEILISLMILSGVVTAVFFVVSSNLQRNQNLRLENKAIMILNNKLAEYPVGQPVGLLEETEVKIDQFMLSYSINNEESEKVAKDAFPLQDDEISTLGLIQVSVFWESDHGHHELGVKAYRFLKRDQRLN